MPKPLRPRGRPVVRHSDDPIEQKRLLQRRKTWISYYYNCSAVTVWARSAVINARKRAKKKNIFHNLTSQQCRDLLPADMVCPILGVKMTFGHGLRVISPTSATIDRIDPDGPYTRENCHVVSNLANRGKSQMNLEELARLGDWAKELLQLLKQEQAISA